MDRRDFLQHTGKLALAAGVLGVAPASARMIASTGPTPAQLRALARQVHGPVVTPSSHSYGKDRRVFDSHYNGMHPRAIVYCESTADVEKTVAWARKHGVRLVPRSGGHSYAGYSTTNSGVVVDVTRMGYVQAHPGGTALVGAGARLIDVYAKLWKRHRMIPGGSCPTVGIAGLTQGGGHGWSARKFGLTCDNVMHLTIVTADGKVETCSASHNEDLFWACRGGGGGNFGIVTNFTFKTHPVNEVSTFYISWPWSHAARVVKTWQAWAPHATPNLGLSVCTISSGSPPSISVGGQFFGSTAALHSLIHPLASIGGANVSVTGRTFFEAVLLYAGCHSVADCRAYTPEAFKAKSDYVHRPLSGAGIRKMLQGIEAAHGALSLDLDSYGGAINHVPAGATAFVHRNMLFSMQYYSSPGTGANLASLNHLYKAMRPYVSGFAYQNYIDPQQPNWPHAYYGANYARLVSVKKKYDPGNFFRFAQSIRQHT